MQNPCKYLIEIFSTKWPVCIYFRIYLCANVPWFLFAYKSFHTKWCKFITHSLKICWNFVNCFSQKKNRNGYNLRYIVSYIWGLKVHPKGRMENLCGDLNSFKYWMLSILEVFKTKIQKFQWLKLFKKYLQKL